MSVISELMNLLHVDAITAEKVRDDMDSSGLDYSACTRRQFNAAAREALDTLQAVHQDMGTGVHPIINGEHA